jgi:limonene 1,2-monooxygenase
VAVASAVTPSGGRAAGRLGLGMLCLAASMPDGFDALDTNWRVAQEIAAEHGRQMDPSVLRLVRADAHRREPRSGARQCPLRLLKWLDYFNKIIPARYADLAGHDPIDRLVETGRIVCGTPDDAIAQRDRAAEAMFAKHAAERAAKSRAAD